MATVYIDLCLLVGGADVQQNAILLEAFGEDKTGAVK